MNREKLESLTRDFIEKSITSIEMDEVPEVSVRVLTNVEGQRLIWRFDRRKDLSQYLKVHRELAQTEEAKELIEYLSVECSYEVEERYLISILRDALGKSGERFDDWGDRVDEIVERIELDSQRRHRDLSTSLLTGIAVGEDIEVKCPFEECLKVEFDNFDENEVIEEESLALSQFGTSSDTSFVEGRMGITVERNPGTAMNELNISFRNLILTALRMYGPCNAYAVRTSLEPLTYDGGGSKGHPFEHRDFSPKFEIQKSDKESLENLLELLSEVYSVGDRGFDHTQLDLAISHLDTSLGKRKNPLESITFAIIGLESIYKHCATGDAYPKTYAAFLLGNAISSMEAEDIQRDIEDAYETRHSVVHGEQDDGDNELKEKMWDYLRASIVVFQWLRNYPKKSKKMPQWLKDHYSETKSMPLNEALIDDDKREDLIECLEDFQADDFLKNLGKE